MRKQFTILLILTFVLGLVPFNFAEAITQNQISAEVQIVCPDNYGNWFSGSGTIIDSKGIILTNKHVVTDQYGGIIKTCFVGFTESINQEPSFGTQSNPNLAEVKYYTTASDMDAAILYFNNPTNKNYTYVDIWNSNSNTLQFGHKIEAIGFPSIGGSTITYTSGDFSGFGSASDGTQNYIKTTTPLEHGNSGGAAYNPAGEFIGIPTMVVAGTLNSLSYILSVNSIKNWLSGILGNNYQQEVIEQKPIIETPKVSIQNDVTPPNAKKFALGYTFYDENNNVLGKSVWTEKNKDSRIESHDRISFVWYENCTNDYCIKDDSNVKGYYYYFGNNPNAVPKADGKYIDSNSLARENFGPLDEFALYPDNQNIKFSARVPEIFTIDESGSYYFILQAVDQNNNISNSIVNYQYVFEGEDFKLIENIDVYDKYNKLIGIINYPKDYYDINHGVVMGYGKPEDQLNVIYTNQDELFLKPNYKFNTNGITYLATKNKFCEQTRCDNGIISKDGLIKWDKYNNLLFFKPADNNNSFTIKHNALTVVYKTGLKNKISKDSKAGFTVNEYNFNSNLVGKILLQVEKNGEAYYVYPYNSKRYYLGRPEDAFTVMRQLGLGATHDFISGHTIFPASVSGKILIDVEKNGEAYYIYPKDKKAYYLGRPADAFQIMRNLGLGITNNDLNKIPEGSL